MDFSLLYQLRKKSSLTDVIFYFFSALLAAVVFFYLIFTFKVYLQNKRIDEINNKITIFPTEEQKRQEKEIFDYKKKIDDFAVIINIHKISSNVFGFIEKKTLPNVWFSNFDMSESTNDIRLSGEAENMESLSRQIKVFEESKDYVKNIYLSNYQLDLTGRVRFSLTLYLNPEVFTYTETSTTSTSVPDNI